MVNRFFSLSHSQVSVWHRWKPIEIEWIETRCYERPMVFFACSPLYQIKFYMFSSQFIWRLYRLSYNMVKMAFATWIFFGHNSHGSWINKTKKKLASMVLTLFCTRMRSRYIDELWTLIKLQNKIYVEVARYCIAPVPNLVWIDGLTFFPFNVNSCANPELDVFWRRLKYLFIDNVRIISRLEPTI